MFEYKLYYLPHSEQKNAFWVKVCQIKIWKFEKTKSSYFFKTEKWLKYYVLWELNVIQIIEIDYTSNPTPYKLYIHVCRY